MADVSIDVAQGRIIVRAPFRYSARLKEVTGRRWDKQRRADTYPASPFIADELAALFRGVDVEASDAVRALRATSRTITEAQANKRADDLPAIPHRPDSPPHWTHQLRAFHFARDLPAVGLFMDMSTGKSRVIVDLVCARQHRKTLIVCPPNVVGVWPREFRKHSTCGVEVCAPRRGPKGGKLSIAKRAKEIDAALERQRLHGNQVVCVVNYEAAWQGELRALLLAHRWDFVVLDESHKIKAPGGAQSMFMSQLRDRADHRALLTGTPMPHSPLDIYPQYRFLEPGIFGTSVTLFRARYAVWGGYNGKQVLRYINEEELAEKMYRVAFRVMADDVFDRDKPVYTDKTTLLSPKGQRIYDDLEAEFVAAITREYAETGTVSAANALVKILRLQQVTSGWVPLDDPDVSGNREWVEVDTSKRDLFAGTLDELSLREPVVVACRFTPDLDNVRYVAEKQGRRYGEISGRRKDGLTDDSLMSPDHDVVGVQIQSGGVGIDLTRSHYPINYSVGHSLGDWEQWVKRTDRPEQQHRVSFVNLACEGTIDEKVYAALAARKQLVEFVLGLAE